MCLVNASWANTGNTWNPSPTQCGRWGGSTVLIVLVILSVLITEPDTGLEAAAEDTLGAALKHFIIAANRRRRTKVMVVE
jgi:hypothetical protein